MTRDYMSYIRQTRVIEDYKSGGTNGWVSTLTDMVKENSDAPPLGGPVVLIVEDEEPIQHILVDAFEDGGFAVETAGTGARAVKMLNERGSHFRALITDINLPGKLSGWDVARVAREANEHIPVIYMTGDSANEWASKGVPNSILIIKPFAIAQVITAVSQLITANEAS
jgi:DNA-binding response OmpR family regulator